MLSVRRQAGRHTSTGMKRSFSTYDLSGAHAVGLERAQCTSNATDAGGPIAAELPPGSARERAYRRGSVVVSSGQPVRFGARSRKSRMIVGIGSWIAPLEATRCAATESNGEP